MQDNDYNCLLNESYTSYPETILFKNHEGKEYDEKQENPLQFLNQMVFNETFKENSEQEHMNFTRDDTVDYCWKSDYSRGKKNNWMPQEDLLLKEYHDAYPNNWKIKVSVILNKTKRQCAYRYNHLYGQVSLGDATFQRFDDVHIFDMIFEKNATIEAIHKEMPQFTIDQIKKRFLFHLLPKTIKLINGQTKESTLLKERYEQYHLSTDLTTDKTKSFEEKVKECLETSIKIKGLYEIIWKETMLRFKKSTKSSIKNLNILFYEQKNYLLSKLTKGEKNLSNSIQFNINDVIDINSAQKNLLLLAKLNVLFNRIIGE